MVSTYKDPSPSPTLVMFVAIFAVSGCALLWFGALSYLESNAPSDAQRATRRAEQLGVVEATFDLGPTNTPKPVCEFYFVDVSSANIRICPDESCTRRDRVPYQFKVCVYGIPEPSYEYPYAEEWFIINLNEGGVFQDIAYMHRSTIKPLNPTATPSDTPLPTQTPAPLPTITPTPSPIPSLTEQPPVITPTENSERPEF